MPPSIPTALADFVARFNRGEYWAAHEALEEPWRKTKSTFYHALILYASAWVHLERQNRPGILAQLDKAEPLLHRYEPGYLGVDLTRLLSDSRLLRALALENRLPEATAPQMGLAPILIRGTEPELVTPD